MFLRYLSIFLISIVLILVASPSLANDSAASIASGGIVLKREAHISMQRERLFISEKKVTVDYDFLNESDHDITTEIAFPVPPFDCAGYCGGLNISDFHVWADGKELRYEREAKAIVKGRDFTEELNKLGIDIASFGHIDLDGNFAKSKDFQIARLSPQDRDHLIQLGLVDAQRLMPLWTAEETYHWSQTFPSGKLTHIRHEYPPAIGYTPGTPGMLLRFMSHEDVAPDNDERNRLMTDILSKSCIDRSLAEKINAEAVGKYKDNFDSSDKLESGVQVGMSWVDYILTTANSWKTPIKDFTLVVERPAPEDKRQHYVSFCWDGRVSRLDADHFVAKASNFIPKKEMHVAYFVVW